MWDYCRDILGEIIGHVELIVAVNESLGSSIEIRNEMSSHVVVRDCL